LKKKNTELYVGLFMVIGFICFAVVAVRFGGAPFFKQKGYTLTANFISVSGLKSGSSVEIAGVPVGKVTGIKLIDGQAKVTLFIHDDTPVEDDAIASIRTKGIIGERYLRLTPGASPDVLVDGDEIFDTESVVDIEDLIGKFIYNN
jgi:phospholipid/cholesterol/gamma-HCH transport system substrate-binding protein